MDLKQIIAQNKNKKSIDLSINILLLVLVLFFVLFGLWKIPKIQVSDKEIENNPIVFESENEARKTLVQIVGGSILLIGLYFAWRRIKVSEENQLTDRFAKSIELLGDKNLLPTRIGGLYALERLASDSEKDYWTIIQLLTAYIRENSPWNESTNHPELPTEFLPPGKRHWDKYVDELFNRPKPNLDIQIAITAIGRVRSYYREDDKQSIDLIGTNLSGVDLREFDFRKTSLWGSNLEFADLSRSNFELSNFYACRMSYITLLDTNMSKCVLSQVDMRSARTADVNFKNANLVNAILSNSTFWGANMEESQLTNAIFEGSSLSRAILKNAEGRRVIFKNAYLRNAILEDAKLQEANFEGANLIEANLRGADLQRANFEGAILTEADLRGADLSLAQNLTQDQLDLAITD